MFIKINNKLSINKNKRPLIIAEISGNHRGSKKLFLEHIREASKCGADLIKIQTYEPQDITIKNFEKKFLIKEGIWKNQSLTTEIAPLNLENSNLESTNYTLQIGKCKHRKRKLHH